LPCGIAHFSLSGDAISIYDINDACWQICGYPDKQTFIDTVSAEVEAVIYPDDRAAFACLAQRVIRTGDRADADLRIVRYDGSCGYVHKTLERMITPEGVDILQDVFMDTSVYTEELRAEQREKDETQRMFRAALENLDVFFWEYDLDARQCINGFKSIEVLGLPKVMEDYPECLLRTGFIVPESVEEYRQLHARMRAGDFSHTTIDVQTVNDSATREWRHISYMRLPDSKEGHRRAFGVSAPVDDYRVSSAMGQALMANGFDFLAVADIPTGSVTVFLDSITGILSKPVTKPNGVEYLADYVRTYVVPEDQEAQAALIDPKVARKYLDPTSGVRLMNRMVDASGQLRTKRTSVKEVPGHPDQILVTRIDVTEAVAKEARDNELLRAALDEARRANDARGEFLSHMSHEMRTPLNGVIGTLDLMADATPEEQRHYLQMASLSARHLANILNDILDMAKIDSGTLGLSPTHMDVRALIDFVKGVVEHQAHERGVSFEAVYTSDVGSNLFADESRLRQIVLNLLTNAVKYTDPGGSVVFTVDEKALGDDEVDITFSVRDTGVGMTKEFMAHAFEPFTQAQRSYSEVGTGLGLPITKSLIEMMGGTLRVRSEIGEGSEFCFSLRLPMHDPDAPDDEQAAFADGAYCPVRDFTGTRALVVDDNPINLMIAQKQFESFGLVVDTAVDGNQAVQLFLASDPGCYDIIFMDVMMPGIDGYEATARIKASGRTDAQVPIIAMTANAFAQDARQSREAGMAGHLPKPFTRTEVMETLNRVL
jgi:signal transduction histidine kinase